MLFAKKKKNKVEMDHAKVTNFEMIIVVSQAKADNTIVNGPVDYEN